MRQAHTYKWNATTLEGFIQQLAVAYVARKYFFYVTGQVPKRLNAAEHDQRMLAKFDVARSKWSRYRRRKQCGPDGFPLANVQYLRYCNFWVLLATAGHHRFFDEHCRVDGRGGGRLYFDVRERPISFGGYSIGWRGRVTVRISPQTYRELRTYFVERAMLGRSTESLERDFATFPLEAYAGVVRQVQAIHRAVNRVRRTAGLPLVPQASLRVKRRVVRPFEPVCESSGARSNVDSNDGCLAEPREEPMLNVTKPAIAIKRMIPAVDLFRDESDGQANAVRAIEQRERLGKVASSLTLLLDRLDIELKVDRERAVAIIAECMGLVDIAVQEIGRIREVDETFGQGGRRVPRVPLCAWSNPLSRESPSWQRSWRKASPISWAFFPWRLRARISRRTTGSSWNGTSKWCSVSHELWRMNCIRLPFPLRRDRSHFRVWFFVAHEAPQDSATCGASFFEQSIFARFNCREAKLSPTKLCFRRPVAVVPH